MPRFSLRTLIVVMLLGGILPAFVFWGGQAIQNWWHRHELERLTREQPIVSGWQSYPPLSADSEPPSLTPPPPVP